MPKNGYSTPAATGTFGRRRMSDLKFQPCLRRTLWDRAIFCDRRRSWPVYVRHRVWRVTSPETAARPKMQGG